MAVGNTSFDDCPMLTWSLGWTGVLVPTVPPRIWMARFAITSLVFMLLEVPEPVWKMSTRNCVVVRPAATSCGGGDDGVGRGRGGQLAGRVVDLGGGLLDQPQRADQPARQAQPADGEVFDGPLRLGAVQRVRRDLAPRPANQLSVRVVGACFLCLSTCRFVPRSGPSHSSNNTSSVRSSAWASSRAPDSSAVVLRRRSASTCTKLHSSFTDSGGSLRMIS